MTDLTERHWVTIGIFMLAVTLLAMAWWTPDLWGVEVFKVIIQAVVLTGLLNMVLAFHFTSNKGSEQARENTGKLADAFKAAANAGNVANADAAAEGATAVADAATEKAHEITEEGKV